MEQLGEVVCLIAISEKVDTEKLVREGMPDDQLWVYYIGLLKVFYVFEMSALLDLNYANRL